MDTKQCTTCKEVKSVDQFDEDERYRSGYRSQCKQCRYDRLFVRRLEAFLRNTYGITLQWYYDKLAAQNEGCAICGRKEARKPRPNATVKAKMQFTRLSIDHCHTTGKIRGLLCHTCNLGLGHFQDNPEFLKNAIRYLEEYQ